MKESTVKAKVKVAEIIPGSGNATDLPVKRVRRFLEDGEDCLHSPYCEHGDHCRRAGRGGCSCHNCRSLCDLVNGEEAVIHSVMGNSINVRRIMALGFSPGAPVRLIRRAPLGDPLEFDVGGCLLTLRAAEADKVMIEVSDIE